MTNKIRLDRLLANLGYGSRRFVQQLVNRGLVTLDGKVLRDAAGHVVLTPDLPERLQVNGEKLDPLSGLVILMHKPIGLICSHHEEHGALVYSLLPARWQARQPAISTVGRLDQDTSGLLLLTDDGVLLHRIISPRSQVPKRYLATLESPLRGKEAAVFSAGTLLLDGETKPLLPAELEVHSPTSATITLHEGRYHQVRRMFAAVGNHVTTLHRLAMGGLALPADLAPGQYRLLTPAEINSIFPGS